MYPLLPNDVVPIIHGYGRLITFEHMWENFRIDEILSAHNRVSPSIADEFENQTILQQDQM